MIHASYSPSIGQRLHVKIYDAEERVYQVPADVVPRPLDGSIDGPTDLTFDLVEDPFSFMITRKSDGDVLFDTSASALVFESTYLRLRTALPDEANLYGLGESRDALRLPRTNYSHTFFNAGEPYLPKETNLYGSHNVYHDHRSGGTHAVYFLNSNGIKINIDNATDGSHFLEYNSLGGVFDFYFMTGSSPKEVATQYAEVVGYPALMPYWGYGFHQCRYGYRDIYDVAGAIANYSEANIPLETMWTDIDYMNYRRTMSLDPARFELSKVRQVIDHLHAHQQNYIVMVDPAVALYPYKPFEDGLESESFFRRQDGLLYRGVVWAGPSVFPDWFKPGTQDYWTNQFARFFDQDTGVDIDGLWIDMNEASNFCDERCIPNAELFSIRGLAPPRPPVARLHPDHPISGFPDNFQPHCTSYVTFNVQAEVDSDKYEVLIMGDAFALAHNEPHDAPIVYPYAKPEPVFNLTVQLAPHSTFTYKYLLYAYGSDGTYSIEKQDRTVTTGGCNTLDAPQEVQDQMDTSAEDQFVIQDLYRAQIPKDYGGNAGPQQVPVAEPGSMQGLSGRELLYPAYNISNYWPWGNLSVQTIPTDLIHSNGYVEYDVHNLYGS